ncbi:MAG TPA: dynamin family protein [Microbacteriaceae bacterium]|nr:dynamin family protein [Microbacteriaceae bacterium]
MDIQRTASLTLTNVKALVASAKKLYSNDVAMLKRLNDLEVRLEEPLRIALVGSLKAGKSTLLNGLLGERVAPTDSRECTKIVTWYHQGNIPTITGTLQDDKRINLPAKRQDDRLELELSAIHSTQYKRIDVTWPAPGIEGVTLIDTPGIASISQDLSHQTDDFLLPDGGASGADAVVYLLRSLHESDIKYMRALHEHTKHGNASIASIAVLSRADELASGRLTAMLSINETVEKLRNHPELKQVCETIVPVAGLLGMGAMTLRQSEFSIFRKLAEIDPEETHKLLMTAERFITAKGESLPTEQTRINLVDRFGMYGIRLALASIRGGIRDSEELSLELIRRSGLEELRRIIDVHFKQRQSALKAHSVMLALHKLLRSNKTAGAEEILLSVDEEMNATHTFDEMRLLGQINGRQLSLSAADITRLEYLIGGRGLDQATRLGCAGSRASREELLETAVKELKYWRDFEANPLLDTQTWRASKTATKSCEILIGELLENRY